MHSYKSPCTRAAAPNASSPPASLSTASLPVDTGKASLFLYVEALHGRGAARGARRDAGGRLAYATAHAPPAAAGGVGDFHPGPRRRRRRARRSRRRRASGPGRRASCPRSSRSSSSSPPSASRRPATRSTSCRRRCARSSAPACAECRPAARGHRRAAASCSARGLGPRGERVGFLHAKRDGGAGWDAGVAGGGRARRGGGQRDLPRRCRRLRGLIDGADISQQAPAAVLAQLEVWAGGPGARRCRAHRRWRRDCGGRRRRRRPVARRRRRRCGRHGSAPRRRVNSSCPPLRLPPAVVARATATASALLDSTWRVMVPLKDSLGRVRHRARVPPAVGSAHLTDEAKNVASVAALGATLENVGMGAKSSPRASRRPCRRAGLVAAWRAAGAGSTPRVRGGGGVRRLDDPEMLKRLAARWRGAGARDPPRLNTCAVLQLVGDCARADGLWSDGGLSRCLHLGGDCAAGGVGADGYTRRRRDDAHLQPPAADAPLQHRIARRGAVRVVHALPRR